MSRKTERWAREEAAHQEHEAALTEIQRLRTIIKTAYSSQGWDIGTVKAILIPGLEGYEHSWWAKAQSAEPEPIKATVVESYHAGDWDVSFSPGSSRDAWWIDLALGRADVSGETDHVDITAELSMSDVEVLELIDVLSERVLEGRKRFNE